MSETAKQLLDGIDLADKYGLPKEIIASWMLHENTANALALHLVKKYGDKFFDWLYEACNVTNLPISQEQLTFYKKRYQEIKDINPWG